MIKKFNIKNCIYLGKVFHARLKPKKHSFGYKVFYINIDLNDIKKKSCLFFYHIINLTCSHFMTRIMVL
ncbi:MAG: hypothetical protein CMJ06_01020 [Pelagibacterales bacterium]|nr:hypothetical protein [Pelagibacterales bacterium]OUU63447.1 MAG: hypothetical protein CBC22_00990 [Alphaproteobacteria bacterium TMED62]